MNLKSAQIISTGTFKPQRLGWSKPKSEFTQWVNEDETIQIWKVQIWMGMDIMGRGDYWFRLIRNSDESLLGLNNWDHYSEPSGANDNVMIYDYAPNYFEIKKDDSIGLYYGTKRWNPIWPFVMRGDISVTIWYTEVP